MRAAAESRVPRGDANSARNWSTPNTFPYCSKPITRQSETVSMLMLESEITRL
jgi:hypothetical protein